MAEEGEETRPQGGEEPPISSEEKNGETNGEAPLPAGEAGLASVFPSVAVNIWPPSKRTRDAVIQRLVLNLSTESILSKRYPLLPPVEASEAALRIEEEAFAAASAAASATSDGSSAALDDGIATLQIYSREISKRMLETVKAKAASASGSTPAASPSSSNGSGAVENPPPTGAGEESSGSSPA